MAAGCLRLLSCCDRLTWIDSRHFSLYVIHSIYDTLVVVYLQFKSLLNSLKEEVDFCFVLFFLFFLFFCFALLLCFQCKTTNYDEIIFVFKLYLILDYNGCKQIQQDFKTELCTIRTIEGRYFTDFSIFYFILIYR